MSIAKQGKYQFDIQTGNNFELLIDGKQFFPTMLDAINGAKKTIMLEQYLMRSGKIAKRFIDALLKAKQREVDVFILLDDYGSSALEQADRDRLVNGGIKLWFYNPIRLKHLQRNFFRDHRKILIIDHSDVFVGGAGITDEFSSEFKGQQAWHDVMLKIQGLIVHDWVQLFHQTWQHCSNTSLTIPESNTQRCSADMTGRILTTAPLHPQEINRALLRRLTRAKQRIWITTPYFVASQKIRRHLRHAARRGLDVRLLLPGPHNDHPWIGYAARRYYLRLLRYGVRIFEYQPRFTHAKIELCDDWTSLGSSNLDRWNQRWNLDANQAVYDKEFAQHITRYFKHDFAQSQEILFDDWKQRPWLTRVREHIAGQLMYLLERVGRSSYRRRK
ncbi:MAG: phosphatidylserine/phosphatidylglycerophosphate/cardiolipin synthase family protein [Gammaproteobacteria bacterium]|nr:phosphatidylserine/phosphatidylglycerophosphate/cardiolipin synthase family protein [Gammaproteobacteria bacterium]